MLTMRMARTEMVSSEQDDSAQVSSFVKSLYLF